MKSFPRWLALGLVLCFAILAGCTKNLPTASPAGADATPTPTAVLSAPTFPSPTPDRGLTLVKLTVGDLTLLTWWVPGNSLAVAAATLDANGNVVFITDPAAVDALVAQLETKLLDPEGDSTMFYTILGYDVLVDSLKAELLEDLTTLADGAGVELTLEEVPATDADRDLQGLKPSITLAPYPLLPSATPSPAIATATAAAPSPLAETQSPPPGTPSPTRTPTSPPTPNPLAGLKLPGTTAPPSAVFDNAAAHELFRLTNVKRREAGLNELIWSDLGATVAQAHCIDMGVRGYFAHNTPEGLTPFQRMQLTGLNYRAAAENLSCGGSWIGPGSPPEVPYTAPDTAQQAMEGLWNSPGHKANILGNYTHLGVGFVFLPNSPQGGYYCQIFYTP